MKKIKDNHPTYLLLLILMLLGIQSTFAQGWERTYLSPFHMGFKVKEDANNNLVVFGDRSAGNMFMMRTDGGGYLIDTTYRNELFDWDFKDEKLNLTADGGLIGVISDKFTWPGGIDDINFNLIKWDANGFIEWNMFYGDSLYNDEALGVIQTSDGGYLVTGSWKYDSVWAHSSIMLVKTDANGNLEWEKTYTDPNISAGGNSVAETPNGDFIIAGTNDDSNNPGAFLMKVSAQGDSLWTTQIGGDRRSEKAMVSNTGDIYVGGDVRHDIPLSDYNTWLSKADSQGNIQWSQEFDPPHYSDFADFQVTSDGGVAYLLNADTWAAYQNVFLKKLDSNGTLQWEREFGGALCERAISMTLASDGGYLITGGRQCPVVRRTHSLPHQNRQLGQHLCQPHRRIRQAR